MAEQKADYYEVLELQKGASDDDIKKAYRRLAMKYHPDVNQGDAEAEKRFKEINEAYSVLSDEEKRSRYDRFGHAGLDPTMRGFGDGGGFGSFDFGDLGDIFGSFFGGMGGMGGTSSASRRNMPMQGDDISTKLTIEFEEAAFGCKKEISYNRVQHCDECSGSGAAKGTSPETCQTCQGTGQVKVTQRTAFGMMQTARSCEACRGTGKIIKNPCDNCRGTGYIRITKKLDVSIPAGIDHGQSIRLRGQGNEGRNGGPAGDLIVGIVVKPHKVFERDGADIYCEIPITFPEAALGAEIRVPTLEEDITYTIPEGTQTGTTFRLRNKGIQIINTAGRGSLIFKVVVDVPRDLNSEQKEALRKFAEVCGDSNYKKKKSFFEKLISRVKDMVDDDN